MALLYLDMNQRQAEMATRVGLSIAQLRAQPQASFTQPSFAGSLTMERKRVK